MKSLAAAALAIAALLAACTTQRFQSPSQMAPQQYNRVCGGVLAAELRLNADPDV
jgi:hypothetical protein